MRICVFALAAALTLTLAGCGQTAPAGSAPESATPSSSQEEVLPPESSGAESASPEDAVQPEPTQPDSDAQAPAGQEAQTPAATITQEEALALAEDHFGEKDEATGNTFSVGFENMVTLDGVEYYNFRVSWLVNGDHMSYLTNYLVSLDGKEMKEYLPQEQGAAS